MILSSDNLCPELPPELSALLYLERYINDGSPNQLSFVNAPNAGFSPKFGLPWVRIPLIQIDGIAIQGVGAGSGSDLLDHCLQNSTFPVHPDVLGFLTDDGRSYRTCAAVDGVPSASGRTLLIKDGDSYRWLKLSYPGVLGRFASPLNEGKVKHSLAVSEILTQSQVLFLEEKYGAFACDDHGATSELPLGFLIREVVPSGHKLPGKRFVPIFSLIAIDADHQPGLLDILRSSYQNATDAAEDLFERIFHPLMCLYWDSANLGLIPEAHAQNLLADVSGSRVSYLFRDCQGFARDNDKLTSERSDAIRGPSGKSLLIERSRRYDDYFGRYVLLPLILKAASLNEVSVDRLRFRIQELTAALAPSGYFESSTEWYEMPLWQPQYDRRIHYKQRLGHPFFR
jgi:hypothetical protein